MRVLTSTEQKTLEHFFALPQDKLKAVMSHYLRKQYPKVIETKDYLFCEGTIPVCMVAHLDTVFSEQPSEIYYDRRKNVMFSPQGLGADDRAGVFSILKLVQDGLRPHIILTTGEEKGGIGARALAKLTCPFRDVRYFIELDRRGALDCVFYECDNPEFTRYVESFGFFENWGTYSDICEFCDTWGIAGVNLSIGYENEHTHHETLNISYMFSTLDKVKKMLACAFDAEQYKFIRGDYTKFWATCAYGYGWGFDSDVKKCGSCGKYHMEEELFPVVTLKGTTAFYCPDCLTEKVAWCKRCGSAYEKVMPEEPDEGTCPHCAKEKKNDNNRRKDKK